MTEELDITYSELREQDEEGAVAPPQEIREELEDYYEAREILDEMIVQTERFLEDIITLRELEQTIEDIPTDENGLTALDRL